MIVSAEVAQALGEGRPVVALESTIFSTLGLPRPHNRVALERCDAAVRAAGAIPAMTVILDGVARVGVESGEWDLVLNGDARKVAERDVAVAIAQRWPVAATTVSASLALAATAGIVVFTTGGIGGVHRGDGGDISAVLDALAHHPVICVCAGAKGFLDLPKTLEYLETFGVPVLGYRHDDFPAFYLRSSGLRAPHRVEGPDDVAAIFLNRLRRGGVLVTVPIPTQHELSAIDVNQAIEHALAAAARGRITGAAITPYVLAALGRATGGRSVPANLALAENNATVAGHIATRLATRLAAL